MRSRFFLFLIFTLTMFPLGLPSPAAAEEGKVERVQNYIAVIDLDVAKGLDPFLRVILTNAVIDELVKIGRYEVIDRANRDKILEEQGFQLKDCVEERCRVDMGKLLGVGKIVTGSLNRLGETSIGMIQLVNVETGKIEASASEKCKCEPEDLLDLVRVLAGKLMGLPVSFSPRGDGGAALRGRPEDSRGFPAPESGAKGGLYIKTDPPGAAVTLNDQRAGDTPLTMANLPAGPYRVEARKGNYYGQIKVTVTKDQFTTVSVPMELMKARLTVITEPPEARIYLDGREAGYSPATLTEVAMGTHRVEAEKKGYLRTGKDVGVSGTEGMVTITLSFRPGYLSAVKTKRKVANAFAVSGSGLAAAGTALAVIFKLQADSAYDSYKGASVPADLERYRSDTESNRNITYIGLGVVGAGVITAVIALFARPQMPKEIKGSRIPGFEGSMGVRSAECPSTVLRINGLRNEPHKNAGGTFPPSGFQAFAFPGGMGMGWKF